MNDERTLAGPNRMIGFLGPRSSSFTLAWLASHRGRLRSFLLGGKRLSLLVVWDTKGAADACRSETDVAAVRQLVYGDSLRSVPNLPPSKVTPGAERI